MSRCYLILRFAKPLIFFFFFFNDPATTEIYTLSLHDALPISDDRRVLAHRDPAAEPAAPADRVQLQDRSEEHTSELQSQSNLVCRLLLEKKKKKKNRTTYPKKTRQTPQELKLSPVRKPQDQKV